MVDCADEGIGLNFVISGESPKLKNIERDDRASMVIGRDFHGGKIKAAPSGSRDSPASR